MTVSFIGTIPEFCYEVQHGAGKGRSWNMVSDLICRTADTEYYYFMAAHKGKKIIISKPLSVDLDFTSMVYKFDQTPTSNVLDLLNDPTMGLEVQAYLRKQHLIEPMKEKGEITGWSPYFEHYSAEPRPYSSKSDAEMKKKLTTYITKGYDVDERLVRCYAADLVHPTMAVAADLYMPYNDHQIVYTNPGTGKSKIAERTSLLTTRMSSAWMKGFSTATKADTHVGGLSGMTSTITFDEFQSDDKFVKSLPSIYTVMDSGIDVSLTGHGAPPLDTRFKLRLCGNPGDEGGNAEYELLMLFNDFLEKSTDNYQAMGRRFGLILFSNDFNKVEGTKLSVAGFKEAFYEWSAVSNALPPKVDQLYAEEVVLEYLNKHHDKKVLDAIAGYETMMGASLQMQVFKRPTRAFVSELGLNYRRMRGMSLKLAIFDNCWSFLQGKITPKQLVIEAEKNYKYLIQLQIQSLDNLFGVEISASDIVDFYKAKFAELGGSERALVRAAVAECTGEQFVPVKMLKIGKYYDKNGNISLANLDLTTDGMASIISGLKKLNVDCKIIAGELLVRVNPMVSEELSKVCMIDMEANEHGVAQKPKGE